MSALLPSLALHLWFLHHLLQPRSALPLQLMPYFFCCLPSASTLCHRKRELLYVFVPQKEKLNRTIRHHLVFFWLDFNLSLLLLGSDFCSWHWHFLSSQDDHTCCLLRWWPTSMQHGPNRFSTPTPGTIESASLPVRLTMNHHFTSNLRAPATQPTFLHFSAHLCLPILVVLLRRLLLPASTSPGLYP